MDNKNKNPNVPNLRFRSFSENWTRYCASDLLESVTTNSLTWDDLNYDSGIVKNIHYGLIHKGFTETCISDKNPLIPWINGEKALKNYTLVGLGDLILADASEDRKDVGKPIEIIDTHCVTVSGLHTIHAKDKTDYFIPGYKGFYFQSSSMKNQIYKIANGSKIYGISPNAFNELYISIPNKNEQAKIVDLLIKIEERISTQNKIIEDLKLLKDSIIDYLYNHNGGLEYKFKDLYTKAKEGGTPSTTVTSYYKNGQIPFIKIDDLNSKYIIHNQTYITNEGMKNSSAWLIPINSVILSNGATIGVTSINTYPVTTKQGILGIIPSKLVNYEYLYYLLNTSVFKKNLKKITTKGTMECAYIKDIDNIILRVPTLDVQLKSVKILNSLDKRLAIENNMINEYKDQKIYLLRNLFI